MGLALSVAAVLGGAGAVAAALPNAHVFGHTAFAQPAPAPVPKPAPVVPHEMVETFEADQFAKGNLHTHSTESDGDLPPGGVYLWYRSHGYQFVALTDHNRRVDPKKFARLQKPGFRILAGEEITMWVGSTPVHVNAICSKKPIKGGRFKSKALAIEHAVDETRAQGAVAILNHPNYGGALDTDDLHTGRGAQLLEIWSGHPWVFSDGIGSWPSHEALWQELLDRGDNFFGVGVDDAHDFKRHPRHAQRPSRPGRAWVQVAVASRDKIDEDELCKSLAAGRFYASNGAELDRISVTSKAIEVLPKTAGAKVEFIGKGGEVLETVRDETAAERKPARYELRADEPFVRARVENPDGTRAWTQAYRTRPIPAR